MGFNSDMEEAHVEHFEPKVVTMQRRAQPLRQKGNNHIRSLFPFTSWIRHYNAEWLASDFVAGLTIGAVVIPQGMAYALLAKLDPQYGLYSSFIGVMTYWIFGTSKDISIGPVAVLSTVVGNVVNDVNSGTGPTIDPHVIASALSLVTGFSVLMMGLLRIGWVVDYIPITSLSAFVTGSAITIISSQLPSLLGTHGYSNRETPYKVIGNTLIRLNTIDDNANMGLSALLLLYLIRTTLTRLAERWSERKQLINFLNTMRTVAVIVTFTVVSWIVNKAHPETPSFAILGSVPKGLPSFNVPTMDTDLVGRMSSFIPAAVIVMLAEHIAIAKSFGRINRYTVNPSQEMVAIGVTNLISPFFGGYASTGSFSRTAIQSKAGVRTPAAGIVAGLVVLFSVYFMTTAFFYIPSAVLAAVVIHAVGDLLVAPVTIRKYWQISPVETGIFFTGVAVSVFGSIEKGLYSTVSLSILFLLFKKFGLTGPPSFTTRQESGEAIAERKLLTLAEERYGTFDDKKYSADVQTMDVLDVTSDGHVTYRLPTDFSFISAPSTMEYLTAMTQTIATTSSRDPNPEDLEGGFSLRDQSNIALRSITLDFQAVKSVDITAMQRLLDAKEHLDAQTAPRNVEWHVRGVKGFAIERALEASGFE